MQDELTEKVKLIILLVLKLVLSVDSLKLKQYFTSVASVIMLSFSLCTHNIGFGVWDKRLRLTKFQVTDTANRLPQLLFQPPSLLCSTIAAGKQSPESLFETRSVCVHSFG